MKAILTGGLDRSDAEARESMNGKAKESPEPFKKVRRSMAVSLFIQMLYPLCSSFYSTMCKKITSDYLTDDCTETVTILRDFFH